MTTLDTPPQHSVPPHDLNAERALLGAMLLLEDAVIAAIDVVDANDFYQPSHQQIFEAIVAVFNRNITVDAVTVAAELGDQRTITGTDLMGLQAETPLATNAEAYARVVADHAALRRLAFAGLTVCEIARGGPTDLADAIDRAEAAFTAATDERRNNTLAPMGASVDEAFERLTSKIQGAVGGLPTGHRDLDAKIDGLHGSRLMVIGARPAMGKTSFALGIALHAAVDQQRPTLFVSLEMDSVELTTRALCSLAKVNSNPLKRKHDQAADPSSGDGTTRSAFSEADTNKLNDAREVLRNSPIWLDSNPTATVLDVKAKARKVKRRCGDLGLVVVDYLQLMSGRTTAENRQVAVAEMSRQLKQLAGELGCPVIALSQLSRNLELRNDKRPMLADLRESGAIEQDADVVVFLYRDEVYNEDSDARGIAEVIVAKQRSGPTGTIKLAWLPHRTTFEDLDFKHVGS